MPYPTEPPREHPSTYIVQDRSNVEEMKRLESQDEMLTASMGGVLPGLTDPGSLQRVLDVGCGTGGWLIKTAQTYPTIKKLVGADISDRMLEHARHQAKAQQLDGRVHFYTMDALRMLEFPESSFDLVNQRAGASWLRTWEWNKILVEYQRVCRPGGIIRITECENIESNGPALTKLASISIEAYYHAGRLFTQSSDGLTSQLARLLKQHRLQNVQTQIHDMVYRAGTVEGQLFYEDTLHFFRLILPFFQKWTRVPSDYEEIYQQALKEMQEPGFVATWRWLTVWGTRLGEREPVVLRGLK